MKERILRQLKELDRLGKRMRLAAEEWDKPWKILISTIMSARTRDEVTIPVAEKLFARYDTIERLAKAKLEDIQKIIRPVNFYKNKSKNVLNCVTILNDKYSGKVPLTIEELIKLPGVGRKTANVFLSEVGEAGLGVDVHVFRIAREIGWSESDLPHKVESDLKHLFPPKYWSQINPILVRFGKTYTKKNIRDELLKKIKEIN